MEFPQAERLQTATTNNGLKFTRDEIRSIFLFMHENELLHYMLGENICRLLNKMKVVDRSAMSIHSYVSRLSRKPEKLRYYLGNSLAESVIRALEHIHASKHKNILSAEHVFEKFKVDIRNKEKCTERQAAIARNNIQKLKKEKEIRKIFKFLFSNQLLNYMKGIQVCRLMEKLKVSPRSAASLQKLIEATLKRPDELRKILSDVIFMEVEKSLELASRTPRKYLTREYIRQKFFVKL